MATCPYCGMYVENQGAKKCPHCSSDVAGKLLGGGAPSQAPGSDRGSGASSGYGADPFNQTPVKPVKKKGHGGLIALIIILAVLLIGGGVGAAWYLGFLNFGSIDSKLDGLVSEKKWDEAYELIEENPEEDYIDIVINGLTEEIDRLTEKYGEGTDKYEKKVVPLIETRDKCEKLRDKADKNKKDDDDDGKGKQDDDDTTAASTTPVTTSPEIVANQEQYDAAEQLYAAKNNEAAYDAYLKVLPLVDDANTYRNAQTKIAELQEIIGKARGNADTLKADYQKKLLSDVKTYKKEADKGDSSAIANFDLVREYYEIELSAELQELLRQALTIPADVADGNMRLLRSNVHTQIGEAIYEYEYDICDGVYELLDTLDQAKKDNLKEWIKSVEAIVTANYEGRQFGEAMLGAKSVKKYFEGTGYYDQVLNLESNAKDAYIIFFDENMRDMKNKKVERGTALNSLTDAKKTYFSDDPSGQQELQNIFDKYY